MKEKQAITDLHERLKRVQFPQEEDNTFLAYQNLLAKVLKANTSDDVKVSTMEFCPYNQNFTLEIHKSLVLSSEVRGKFTNTFVIDPQKPIDEQIAALNHLDKQLDAMCGWALACDGDAEVEKEKRLNRYDKFLNGEWK